MLKTIARACTVLPVAGLFIAGQAAAAPTAGKLILNEWNGVGPAVTLSVADQDPAFAASPVGNGKDWIELVVVADIDTLVGVKFEWANGDPDAGSLTFVDPGNSGIWDNLVAGTIITIRADNFTPATNYDPCSGDFNIEVDAFDTNFLTMAGDNFKTDNDSWKGRIIIPGTPEIVIQGWVGEPSSGATYTTSSGIGNDEVGKLESDPGITPGNWVYNDGHCSSYGQPNCWHDEEDNLFTQDAWFEARREEVECD
ncbi:hypothetical protein [Sorangium sp. So ce124]|uniref:hypothetical protein n=1 Tax=Sorangium sp. So ce124 TaxID=3133280 RepID=UPI003F5F4AE4